MTNKNDLESGQDFISTVIKQISEQVTETHEEFIFETIRPWCENVVQMKISKQDLEQALLKYYGKNDSAVDCIERAELLKAMDTWDKFGYTETGCFVREPKGDYVKYVHYEDMVNCVKGMPSVTPIRPKGHWIGRKRDGFGEWKDVTMLVDLKGHVPDSCVCSECGEWLTGSDEYDCIARYCPNCGAEMESEE